MLQNAYFLAKIGADTAENEQHFAEILSKTGNYPTGHCDDARATVWAARLHGQELELRRLFVLALLVDSKLVSSFRSCKKESIVKSQRRRQYRGAPEENSIGRKYHHGMQNPQGAQR